MKQYEEAGRGQVPSQNGEAKVLSRQGLLLCTQQRLVKGDLLSVLLRLEKESVRAFGQVAWSRREAGKAWVDLQFIEMKERDKEALDDFLQGMKRQAHRRQARAPYQGQAAAAAQP